MTSAVLLSRGSQQSKVVPFTVPNGSGSRPAVINSRANGSLLAVYPAGTPVNIGGFDQTRSLNLLIDDDRPTSSLTTQFAPAGRTVMLGGLASDPTSAISRVEVRIDSGPGRMRSRSGCCPRQRATPGPCPGRCRRRRAPTPWRSRHRCRRLGAGVAHHRGALRRCADAHRDGRHPRRHHRRGQGDRPALGDPPRRNGQ
ncbi:MAG: hypothetical protein HZY76_03440 [Anaerolineae bacterium]|nr:MAG: hypothetical protein HZY76_03440 [Anaerolineae bacterium]